MRGSDVAQDHSVYFTAEGGLDYQNPQFSHGIQGAMDREDLIRDFYQLSKDETF